MDPLEWWSCEFDSDISRYQSRHDMFSSRLPSLSDSLHFVKTLSESRNKHRVEQDGATHTPVHIPYSASSPSRSLTTSGETERIGKGKSIIVHTERSEEAIVG